MAIIRRSKREIGFIVEESTPALIPFVPAHDLLAEKRKRLSDEEVALVASALTLLTPVPSNNQLSTWMLRARIEGITKRSA